MGWIFVEIWGVWGFVLFCQISVKLVYNDIDGVYREGEIAMRDWTYGGQAESGELGGCFPGFRFC